MKATEDLKRALMDVFIHGGTKDHMSDIEIGDEDDPFEKTVDQRIPEKYIAGHIIDDDTIRITIIGRSMQDMILEKDPDYEFNICQCVVNWR